MNRDNIDSVIANNYPCPPGAMAHYAVRLRTDNPLYIFNRIARSHHLGETVTMAAFITIPVSVSTGKIRPCAREITLRVIGIYLRRSCQIVGLRLSPHTYIGLIPGNKCHKFLVIALLARPHAILYIPVEHTQISVGGRDTVDIILLCRRGPAYRRDKEYPGDMHDLIQ